jgi:hypothetical protein
VTIALSSPTRIFKREDFPTFGFPIITVLIPSFNNLPFSKEEISVFMLPVKKSIFSESSEE